MRFACILHGTPLYSFGKLTELAAYRLLGRFCAASDTFGARPGKFVVGDARIINDSPLLYCGCK